MGFLEAFVAKIVAPIAFIAGFIYFLFKGRVPEDKGKDEFIKKEAELETKENAVDTQAGDSVARYERIREEFLRNSGKPDDGGNVH